MDVADTDSFEANETSPCLRGQHQEQCINGNPGHRPSDPRIIGNEISPQRALPLALLSALAMSSTAATAFYAYAILLCGDTKHCEKEEVGKYSTFVATATMLSNMLGLFTLSYFQRLVVRNKNLGLLLWIILRSGSAVALLLGVSIRNIYVALSGRIFEGLASDNLLHFTLNTVYAHNAASQGDTSSLIGYSLALYMAGISVSPFVAGLFPNFAVSFMVAIGLFLLSSLYLIACIPGPFTGFTSYPSNGYNHVLEPEHASIPIAPEPSVLQRATRSIKAMAAPLEVFTQNPGHLATGLSLFCYNIVQSYIFTALVVYTSIEFGFTWKENGILVSIVHSVASVLLLSSLYLVPRIKSRLTGSPWRRREAGTNSGVTSWSNKKDLTLGLTSLAAHTMALTLFGHALRATQIYPVAVLFAAGLSAPSFIKGYFVSGFGEEKSLALAGLAVMEILGSLLGPVVLGGLQTFLEVNGVIFYVAGGIGLLSFGLLLLGSWIV